MMQRSLRMMYGKTLTEMGARYKNLVVLDADLKESTQSVQFEKVYPDRFLNIGVAEQNMVGIAAGLALSGKLPVAHSFASFISMRACEQVRTSVAYPNLNVKFVVSHAGISCGSAGTTHHSIEDIAIMRSIPNMTVLVPGDAEEVRQSFIAAMSHHGPVYLRIGAGEAEDVYTDQQFKIGRATRNRAGDDATIITTGTMLQEGLNLSDLFNEEYGIKIGLLQMASIKPIDVKAIRETSQTTKKIITIEEHNVIGGLGSAVCEVVAEYGEAKVMRIGIKDRFAGVGNAQYIMKEEGLSIDCMALEIKRFMDIK